MLLLVLVLALVLGGCRRDPAPDAGPVEAVADASAPSDPVDASGRVAKGVEERAEARADAGTLPATCAGASVALVEAALDERCRIPELEWARLSAEAVKGLRQEAKVDGDAVVFALVNGGSSPIEVPLRLREGSPDLAFSILAEAGRAVVELVPPRILGADATRRDGAADGGRPVYSARIRLLPGGAARARLVIDPRIGGRVVGDGGLMTTLPKGRVDLHIGQMLTALDAGPPAHFAWENR